MKQASDDHVEAMASHGRHNRRAALHVTYPAARREEGTLHFQAHDGGIAFLHQQ